MFPLHRRFVFLCACVCAVVVLAGLSEAGSSAAVASASGDVPGKALPSGPGSAPAPVAGTFADAVNNLGRSQYPGIYAGDYRNPDGSVTVYVSPGDDTSLIASLRSIDPTSVADASSGALPSIQVVRVPLSISALEEQAASVSKDAYVACNGGLRPVERDGQSATR